MPFHCVLYLDPDALEALYKQLDYFYIMAEDLRSSLLCLKNVTQLQKIER